MEKISIRDMQIEAVTAMINPNAESQQDWKFLIYDDTGEDILAPLFYVKDLKYQGITLRLPIDSERDPVLVVSAVYFILPTDENIERITQDLSKHLYDSYYFNFISALPNSKLKAIAKVALETDSAVSIKRVYSQYLNFIALEDDLFILREREKNLVSYYAINRHDATDSEITAVIDNIVDCLFSVFVTLKLIPVIRCPKWGPAELVAKKLTRRIRNALEDETYSRLFGTKINSQRSSPNSRRLLLCIVDRTIDLSTPLHHTWTYQALIHDLLNIELNKVKIVEYDENAAPKTHQFDLNPGDKFWREQRGSPFPQVAEAVQRELDICKKQEDEFAKDFEDSGDESGLVSEDLKSKSPHSLIELREKKRNIAMHTTIATAVLNEIKARKLDNFFEIEEKIMNRSPVDRVIFDEMISNPDYGQLTDKYRLFLIAYICDNPDLSDIEAEKYADVLERLGCKRAAFEYVKNWKNFSQSNVTNLQSSLQSSGGVLKTASMFTKLMSQGSQFVMAGVKNLVLKEHFLPLTKIIDSLMGNNSKSSRATSDYSYFDPIVSKDSEVTKRVEFQDAIVFVVGGGNYIEYQNLVEYCKSKSGRINGTTRHVIYGSTSLLNANNFLEQLRMSGDIDAVEILTKIIGE